MSAGPSLSVYWSLRYSAGGHFVTRHFSQYIGAVCAWAAQQAMLSPSQVTLLGTATFVCGAVAFVALPDTGLAALACVALFQLGYGLDCADGQLARALNRTSSFGAWLDMACDFIRNVVLATTIATWLAAHGLPTLGATTALLFAAGTAVHLHTVAALRKGASAPSAPRSVFREGVMSVFDTATVLLVIGLLRLHPVALGVAAAGIGIAHLGIAIQLARTRLA